MLPIEDGNNNPKGFITKCIKEMSRVGESSIKIGTLSFCVNHSIGVLKPNQMTIDSDSYEILTSDVDIEENDIVQADLSYHKKPV